jgi:regulator of protease activity HflC (stomatin/prohibitin superfamily)
MEKQMRAERGKRQIILEAEGAKASMILRAEGEKASNVIRAEGEKLAMIKEAEGKARSIELIKIADPNKQVLIMKSYEAIKDLANGNATKIIIPPNLTDIAGIAATFGGVLDPSFKAKKSKNKSEVKPEDKKKSSTKPSLSNLLK